MRDKDGFGALEVRVAGHDGVFVCVRECQQSLRPLDETAHGGVDALADEETHVGCDLLVARAARVELESERADFFGEFQLDEVVDVFGVWRAGDDGGFDLLVGVS